MRLQSFIFFFFSLFLGSIDTISQNLSPQIANYQMDIELDVNNKKLYGKTVLTWKNISDAPVDDLYFHLYYNAFKNSRSTFFRERGVPAFLTQDIDNNCGWGWSYIKNITDDKGNDLSSGMTYVSPDDGNPDDETVLHIPLSEAVPSGESRTYTYEWEAKIPQTMPRTGYNMDYYFFAQWFPKVGVYEIEGMRFAEENGWNCHQYHSSGEYYSDFGNYDVRLTVPSDYIVAASGQLVGQKKKGELKTWNFVVDDVIDFTWTTSPEYVVQESTYKNTDIRLYTYPEKTDFAERYFDAIGYCMAYLDEHLGSYPYPTLSIIDPPIHGMFTGGMEYPTLITSLSFRSFPDGFKTAETLVIHEYIHQYFMQMVATHEVEEAWMDEGITTYYENRILDEYLGKDKSFVDFIGVDIGSKSFNRGEFFNSRNRQIAPNSIKSWEYKHGGYGDIAYNKAALWLQTLEGMIGQESLDLIMKRYFERWKFKHPCRNDFLDVVEEVVSEYHADQFPDGMSWYFDQVLFGTGLCDYAIGSISNTENKGERGFFSSRNECEINESSNGKFSSKIIVLRNGDIHVPIDIVVTMEDGSKKMYNWSGEERSYAIEISSDHRVMSAEVDPEKKVYLDYNFINNSLVLQQRKESIGRIVGKWLTNFSHIVESITMII